MRGIRIFLLACGAVCALRPAGAQRLEARFPRPAAVRSGARDSSARGAATFRPRALALSRRDSSWWVPLASTILPGTGQFLQGGNRFVVYLALEGFALLDYLDQHAEATRQRDRSRALARDVARAIYAGERPVGEWAYYERMEHFIESGVYNRFPGSGEEVSPEVDPTTYNGSLWLDVRQRYWDDPGVEPAHTTAQYRLAYNEYIARAVRPEFQWSWRNAQLERDVFVRAIRRRNQAERDATVQLSILAANHLLSTIDAFVTLRLRGGAGAGGGPAALTASIPWAPFGRRAKQ